MQRASGNWRKTAMCVYFTQNVRCIKSYLLKSEGKLARNKINCNLTCNFASLQTIPKGLKSLRISLSTEDWIKRHDSRSLAKLTLSEGKNCFLGYSKIFPSSFIAGETIYAASTKKATSGGGTLSRRTRRGHASALSSSSTASDRSETVFPDEHTRMHLTNGELKSSFSPCDYYDNFTRMPFSSHLIACHSPPLETITAIVKLRARAKSVLGEKERLAPH